MPSPIYTLPPQGGYLPPAGTPAAGAFAYQPPQQRQPAPQNYQRSLNNTVASDRLPPMPEMLRRPTQNQDVIIRGGAPEERLPRPQRVETVAQADWKPITIPTPRQLGILPADPALARPVLPVATMSLPERYDLATVTAWLDQLGARTCQRERLAEGVRFVCTFQPDQTITARGMTDEEALKSLVQEVVRQRGAVSLK